MANMRFTGWQGAAMVPFAVLLAATWWKPPWPSEQALHHSLTAVALILLGLLQRRHVLPRSSFVAILAFLALHTLAARWLYSLVPYDEWVHALFEVRLSEMFGWQRNHFDRLVHFSYGLLLAPVVRRFVADTGGRHHNGQALLVIMASSAAYELFDWLIAVVLAPAAAEAYNGQQGDMWDAHKDIALAMLGAFVSMLALASSARSTAAARRAPVTGR